MSRQDRKKQKVISLWLEEGISQEEAYRKVFPRAKKETIQIFFSSSKIFEYIKVYFGIFSASSSDVSYHLWKEMWEDAQKIKSNAFAEKNWSVANTVLKTLLALFLQRFSWEKNEKSHLDQNGDDWGTLFREFEKIFNKQKKNS